MRPNIYEFENYREFLKAMFVFLKANSRSFSFRSLSKRAGVSAPGYFKSVADGKRNLSEETILKFGKALGLKPQEAEFFRYLVLFNQATDLDERTIAYEKLVKNRQFQKFHPIQKEQFDYYSNWYYPVVREMVVSSYFNPDPKWVSEKLGDQVSELDVVRALNSLVRLGFLERTNSGYRQSNPTVTTGAQVASVIVAQFHREMLRKAAGSMLTVNSDEREIRSITLSCKQKDFERLKEKVDRMRKEILAEFGEGSPDDELVYQLNFQIFPLTKPFV